MLGSILICVAVLLCTDHLGVSDVSNFLIIFKGALQSVPSGLLHLWFCGHSSFCLLISNSSLRYLVVFLLGKVWGCWSQPSKDLKGKIVGVVPTNVASSDSLAILEDKINKLTKINANGPSISALNDISQLHAEMLKMLSQLKDNMVGCVSKNDLNEALREVHDRIPTIGEFEDTPVIIALKKATGDLQKGVERLSGKVVRLNSDVAAVNATLIESNDAAQAAQIKLSGKSITNQPSMPTDHDNVDCYDQTDADSDSSSSGESEGYVQVLRSIPKETKAKKITKAKSVQLPLKVKQGIERVETVEDLEEKLRAAREELRKERPEHQKLSGGQKAFTRGFRS